MTLKELIISDIKTIHLNPDDFADVFTNARTALNINVIFDKEFVVIVEDIETSAPVITCADADIPGVEYGDLFTDTNTSIVYKVVGIQPDNTGVTLLVLSLD